MSARMLPVLVLIVTGCGSPLPPIDPADRILLRACDYLWSAQSDDGAWHNETHGLMRGGEATTAFVLNSLFDSAANCPADEAKLESALSFLRTKVTDRGALGLSDPGIVDYPNYATAYALSAFVKNGDPSDSEIIERMTGYLASEQFDRDRGITPEHPAFGGWGFGESSLAPGTVGHVDLSHTRRVLQTLRTAGYADTLTFLHGRVFLSLHQRHSDDDRVRAAREVAGIYDGGFFASAALPVVNKSTPVGDDGSLFFFESYATATADGLLGLLAAGVQPDDPRLRDARDWLLSRPDFGYPAGIPEESPAGWGRVMFHYHIMVRAEAYRALGGLSPSGWRDEVAILLEDRQGDDGSFVNPYGAPNKEDDPFIATAMVVEALAQPSQPG